MVVSDTRKIQHTIALKRLNTPFFRIFIFSLTIYGIFSYICPILFFSDSEQYLRTAKAILGQPNGEFYYYRTWGYPLIMNLFGVTILETFYPLLLLQLICAALIPSLVYSTLVNVYPRAAVYAALISAVSFSPGIFLSVIMTDEISMFLRFLLVFIASVCIFKTSKNYLYYLLVTVGFILYLMRPSDALTFLIVPIGMLFFNVGNRHKLIVIILIFISAVLIFGSIRDAIALHYTKTHHINSTSVVGSMTGRMLFFNIYAVGPKIVKRSTINENNGRYSKKLISTLNDWSKKNPMGVNSYSILGASSYPTIYVNIDNPDKFVAALIAEEGLFAHSVMWLALDQQVGAYQADHIFLRAAIESYLSNPKTLLLLYDGMTEFFLSGDVIYNHGLKETWNPHIVLDNWMSDNPTFSQSLKNELKAENKKLQQHIPIYSIIIFLFFWITGIKIISVILSMACIFTNFIFTKKLSCFAAMMIGMLLYHAGVSVAFASPHFRYIVPQVPLIIMLATLGIASFKKLLNSKINKS